MDWLKLSFLLLTLASSSYQKIYRPCSEISRELRFPCRCSLGPIETALSGNPAIYVDCDRVVFSSDLPALPFGAPIVSFTQRWAGHQSLPTQIFSTTSLPLRSIDLSHNSLRRITETLLSGFRNTLTELRLSNNLLGDTLNPIFSSNEFHGLRNLQILDLSGNMIRSLEEGIFEGCINLENLILDSNNLVLVPSSSLNGPKSLKTLSLRSNRIGDLKYGPLFQSQKSLEVIDLSDNLIASIEATTFADMEKLKTLRISKNKLTRFNSDVFEGANNIEEIDLSENFISKFPTLSLVPLENLKYLNLSSNMIQTLDHYDLDTFANLQVVDLSRNNIANIGPGTFLGLKKLKKLDISVNSLRTVEDDAFEGLNELQELNLKDNNILLIPASALGRLPKLMNLQLDYNRIAALSSDILRSIAAQVTTLSISKNIIRELPQASFQYFEQLKSLDLSRNLITNLNTNAFSGLETSLIRLDLSKNKIAMISGMQWAFSKLQTLDISENYLMQLGKGSFDLLPSLRYLNLSHNEHIKNIPLDIFQRLSTLETIDLSYTSLKSLSSELFGKSYSLKNVYLSHNLLTEISNNVFANLPNLTTIDLSHNNINNIRQGAFVNVMGIKKLILNHNQLSSFKGELFNTGTGLEILDISDNQLSYLYPSSFRIHPRLKEIHAAKNKFNFFPAELIATLQYLEFIDLSGNYLKTVDELDFARLPRLRTLKLSNNQLESISEMAFHNSTQLQYLDLSNNKLDRLGERTFEGLVRIEMLDLKSNKFADLPETIFDRTRLDMLENINLSDNLFEKPPLAALQRQYFFISSVDLSSNQIQDIPSEDSIMVNIKKLDLSFNPLTPKSVKNVLGEPKTVRHLNLAGTGITEVVQLETPFLNSLNLSSNFVNELPKGVFDRTSLVEHLDLSNNSIVNISNLQLENLRNIQSLNLSNNPIISIAQNDFHGLEDTSLRTLSIYSLKECVRIEKAAFAPLNNLKNLQLYDIPKLGYLDINGLLQKLPSLQYLNIETKDASIGSDQFNPILHANLKELGIMGDRLKSISSGTFSGLKGEYVKIKLVNTSLTSLPPALFFAVPRSSKIDIDVTGSLLSSLSPQILTTIDDRRGDLKIIGLDTNPIMCDCGARALRRWLPAHMASIKCTGPEYFAGKYLVEIGDDELTCDPRKRTTTTESIPSPSSTHRTTKYEARTTEPEIIWSVPSTEKAKPKMKPKSPMIGQSTLNNEDTLIISIVGGVVGLIAILIIIICIVRLRMSGNQYKNPMMNATPMGPMMGPGSSCACSVKGVPPIYSVPPSYSATLPHKISGPPSLRPSNYSTMGRMPYGQNTQPYFIATYPSDEKIYR